MGHMDSGLATLSQGYRRTLAGYLRGAGEVALLAAYDLGRAALADGLSVLDLIVVHHRALAELWPETEAVAATLECAQALLLEALSPFEVARREFKDGNKALRRLNDTLEDEVRRIAHALHDDAGQLLASASLALEAHLRRHPEHAPAIAEVRTVLDGLETHLRRMSHELRPTVLDNLGLVPALEMLAQGVQARAQLEVSVDGSTEGRLPPAVAIALYRAAQEALTNVVRHAHAHRVRIEVRRTKDAIACTVTDDGRGLRTGTQAQGGIGLIGIRERLACVGGALRLGSRSVGVSFEAIVPLAEDARPSGGP